MHARIRVDRHHRVSPMSFRWAWLVVGMIVTVVAVASRADADGALSQDDPRHLGPVPSTGVLIPPAPRMTQYPLRPQGVILDTKESWRSYGHIDKSLSEACSMGRFTERYHMQYRAFFKEGEVLGGAYGNGVNLVDPGHLAKPGMIYLFRNGDSTNCVVSVLSPQDVKAANAARNGKNGLAAPPRAGGRRSP